MNSMLNVLRVDLFRFVSRNAKKTETEMFIELTRLHIHQLNIEQALPSIPPHLWIQRAPAVETKTKCNLHMLNKYHSAVDTTVREGGRGGGKSECISQSGLCRVGALQYFRSTAAIRSFDCIKNAHSNLWNRTMAA